MGILRADRITGLGGANAITGSTFFGGGISAESGGASQNNLQLNLSSDFNLGTNDFTIEAFIYLEALGQFNNILAVGTDSTNGYRMDLGTGNNLRLVTKLGSAGWGVLITGGTTFVKNKWYHVAVTRSGSSFDLWVDGTKDATTVTNSDSVLDATVNDANGGDNNVGVEIGSLSTYGYSRKFDGYISNLHLVNGTALYTSSFSIPTARLEKRSDTVLLACNSAGNVLNEETGKTITRNSANRNSIGPIASRFTPNSPVGFSTITDVGSQYGSTFDGFGSFATSTYMVPPGGNTRERNRGRALYAGGYQTPNTITAIDSLEIQSGGMTKEFGNLSTTAHANCSACSSSTRMVTNGGWTGSANNNTMEFVTIANESNSTDFGDLAVGRRNNASVSNQTRGLVYGGNGSPANTAQVDFFTIATAGNAADFGDASSATALLPGSASSSTRALFAGGYTPSAVNTIDYFTIATTGDAVDFGDLSEVRKAPGGLSSSTRSVFGGGGIPSASNTIDYVTTATTGNALNFGDLFLARSICDGTSDQTRGIWMGGTTSPARQDTIDSVTIASQGNAVNWGDFSTTEKQNGGASSDSHGGL